MAQTEKPPRQSQSATNTRIARIDRPNADTLVLQTFWSPLPTWIYGSAAAAILAAIAALIGAAVGADGDDIVNVALLAAVVGYIVAALGWAVLGLVGGDVQRITFDRREDVAHVHQRLLWLWRRDWDFELDEIYRMHIWQKRGRFVFKLSVSEIIDLTFTNDPDSAQLPDLNLGVYPSEIEGVDVGKQVAEFLDIPISRNPPES